MPNGTMTDVKNGLQRPDDVLETQWADLCQWAAQTFHRAVSVDGLLFLIGLQETHTSPKRRLEKETKQDLIVEGSFHVLAALGFYQRTETEPFWQPLAPLPRLNVDEQEKLLRMGLIRYFEQTGAYVGLGIV